MYAGATTLAHRSSFGRRFVGAAGRLRIAFFPPGAKHTSRLASFLETLDTAFTIVYSNDNGDKPRQWRVDMKLETGYRHVWCMTPGNTTRHGATMIVAASRFAMACVMTGDDGCEVMGVVSVMYVCGRTGGGAGAYVNYNRRWVD